MTKKFRTDLLRTARKSLASDELNFDANPKITQVSPTSGWVQAWVWVELPEEEDHEN